MTWILVMYIYAGVMAQGDSVTMLAIPNFASQKDCNTAGNMGSPLTQGSAKSYRFVCLPQPQPKG